MKPQTKPQTFYDPQVAAFTADYYRRHGRAPRQGLIQKMVQKLFARDRKMWKGLGYRW